MKADEAAEVLSVPCCDLTTNLFRSCFLRYRPQQLNFYSFRKIKYADTIRINPQLEKETANYWRFRHENFRRGHPELLTEIKRMNGGQKGAATTSTTQKTTTVVDKNTKSEVQTLKKRIEEMSKNIDELTAMVQQVTIKQEATDNVTSSSSFHVQDNVPVGTKRPKIDPIAVRPDIMLSTGMELDEITTLPPVGLPLPAPLYHRESSDSTNVTDSEFVDELFSAFNDDEMLLPEPVVPDPAPSAATLPPPVVAATPTPPPTPPVQEHTNRPDPELMNRLGEALALLPKDIQTLIVDRLIAAIMSPGALESSSSLVADAVNVEPKKIAASGKALPTPAHEEEPQQQQQPFPLAAATLAALLHHYSTQVKGKPKSVQKAIPVIPVHA